MKAFNFIIIKLTFCLIAGILLSHYSRISLFNTFCIIIGLFLALIITQKIAGQTIKKSIWFGLITYVLMFILGVLSYNTHHQKNFPNHYTNLENLDTDNSNLIIFKINERLKPTQYHNKYIVELKSINEQSVRGKCLLNININANSESYHVDDILFTKTEFQEISGPLNPNQFNYKMYLEKQYIYHQIYVKQHQIFDIASERHSLYGYADALRQTINYRLNQYEFKPEELAIINALILGQRQDMDRDIYTQYVKAGAIHILAVSGLHVGIILMILNVALKPLEHIKRGRLIKVFIILILLWSFAIIAGLSASVTRAVTMFSIVAIAMHLKRPTNIYNTLFISMFILLLVNPMFLLDVGFQMSYLAVFAIVTIQPLLHKIWKPKWKLIDYFWKIFTVTIAAQLGVAPISLFYFHQFPGLFFVSNLAIIPFLGLILGLGILVILLSLLNILPEQLATFFGKLINTMNQVVSWVSNQDSFIIKDVSFDLSNVLSSYIILLALIMVYKKFHFKRIIILIISIVLLQCNFLYSKYKQQTTSFIIFHESRYSVLGLKENSTLKVWHNLDSNSVINEKMIKNFKVGNFVESIAYDSLYSIYKTPHKTILVIDSLGVYNVSFKPDYILLTSSPKINLKRVITLLNPELIIADASNYKSYLKRWKATCLKEKLPFHQTSEKGALIIK